MTVTSYGYDGTIDEVAWSKLADYVGRDYAFGSMTDLVVTTTTGDRTVKVSNGSAFGHGVLDVCTSLPNIQLPTITAGSRWDTIVVRRDWQAVDPGGSTSVTYVRGGASKALASGLNATPGVLDDQALALVQVTAGQTAPTAVVMLPRRVKGSPLLYGTSLTRPGLLGQSNLAAPAELMYESDTGTYAAWNGATWEPAYNPAANNYWFGVDSVSGADDSSGGFQTSTTGGTWETDAQAPDFTASIPACVRDISVTLTAESYVTGGGSGTTARFGVDISGANTLSPSTDRSTCTSGTGHATSEHTFVFRDVNPGSTRFRGVGYVGSSGARASFPKARILVRPLRLR